jgi:hypothetical protein
LLRFAGELFFFTSTFSGIKIWDFSVFILPIFSGIKSSGKPISSAPDFDKSVKKHLVACHSLNETFYQQRMEQHSLNFFIDYRGR